MFAEQTIDLRNTSVGQGSFFAPWGSSNTFSSMEEETMETTEALKIITSLADGRDPGSGGPLPDTDPCQQPQAIRALYAAANELGRRARRGERAGQPWDDDEDRRLVSGHEQGLSPKVLARGHGRSVTAIHHRLEMLGQVTEGVRTSGNGGYEQPPHDEISSIRSSTPTSPSPSRSAEQGSGGHGPH